MKPSHKEGSLCERLTEDESSVEAPRQEIPDDILRAPGRVFMSAAISLQMASVILARAQT